MKNKIMDNELFTELDNTQSLAERYLGLSWTKFLLSILFVLTVGIYIGILLFGDNSLDVLLRLESYEDYLKKEITRLKQENATLQKEYFELKELDADN